jgi:hypothetical protein
VQAAAEPAAVAVSSRGRATPHPAAPSEAEVTAVLQQLSSSRAEAFATADLSRLDAVTVSGSPADRRVRADLRALIRAGLRYRGLDLRVRTVSVRSVDEHRLVVDVVTDVSAYDVVDASGHVSRHVAASGGTTSRLVVSATRRGWRVAEARA